MPCDLNKFWLPITIVFPSTSATTPLPDRALNAEISSNGMPRWLASAVTASPSGCSLPVSTDAANWSSFSSLPSNSFTIMSVTFGWPRVIVPVLSNTTTSTDPACSRLSLDLIKMPIWAPLPVPTITAVGVASPIAQGHAITNTETEFIIALASKVTSEFGGRGIRKYQIKKVITAIPITIGTKIAEILSARFWIGALLACASSTSFMIWDRAVSLPIFVASNFIKPDLFRVAPNTLSPGFFSTGRDSPVSMLSSMLEWPSTTMPSTAIFSPGLTITISPTCKSSAKTSISIPSCITEAFLGRKFNNFRMASPVPPLALASRYLPNLTRVIITAEVSKKPCPGMIPSTTTKE